MIALTKKNASDLIKRYYGFPAKFLEEILGMELDIWQRELCDEFHKYDRHAICSGHSSGKTAITAGLIQYFLAMHPNPQVIVTANTELQLRQKTWRELAKWHKKSLIGDWFHWTATTFSLKESEDTWFAAAVPNTPHSAESFAGAHEKYMLMIFDEASAIERAIWETAEGATATDGGYRKWLVFGNGTRNDGAFFECFNKSRHRWRTRHLDVRTCRYADQTQIQEWAEDYGEDSDFFRVRVRGLFPQQSVVQLIGYDVAVDATKRFMQQSSYDFAPKILSVDVARFGDDSTVVTKRQGLMCYDQAIYRGKNTMEVADIVGKEIAEWYPQAVFVDETGLGAGVVDRLRQLGHKEIIGVNGAASPGNKRFLNKRIEMWSEMADWLKIAKIPNTSELIADLTSPEYFYNSKGQLVLESKDSLKKRGQPSPDRGDSLALSFAYPVKAMVDEKTLPQSELDWRMITGYNAGKATNLDDYFDNHAGM